MINLSFSISLENPEASRNRVSGRNFLDRLPDGVVALEYNDDWGQFRMSALGRQLTSPDDKADEIAYGINVSGTYAIWPRRQYPRQLYLWGWHRSLPH